MATASPIAAFPINLLNGPNEGSAWESAGIEPNLLPPPTPPLAVVPALYDAHFPLGQAPQSRFEDDAPQWAGVLGGVYLVRIVNMWELIQTLETLETALLDSHDLPEAIQRAGHAIRRANDQHLFLGTKIAEHLGSVLEMARNGQFQEACAALQKIRPTLWLRVSMARRPDPIWREGQFDELRRALGRDLLLAEETDKVLRNTLDTNTPSSSDLTQALEHATRGREAAARALAAVETELSAHPSAVSPSFLDELRATYATSLSNEAAAHLYKGNFQAAQAQALAAIEIWMEFVRRPQFDFILQFQGKAGLQTCLQILSDQTSGVEATAHGLMAEGYASTRGSVVGIWKVSETDPGSVIEETTPPFRDANAHFYNAARLYQEAGHYRLAVLAFEEAARNCNTIRAYGDGAQALLKAQEALSRLNTPEVCAERLALLDRAAEFLDKMDESDPEARIRLTTELTQARQEVLRLQDQLSRFARRGGTSPSSGSDQQRFSAFDGAHPSPVLSSFSGSAVAGFPGGPPFGFDLLSGALETVKGTVVSWAHQLAAYFEPKLAPAAVPNNPGNAHTFPYSPSIGPGAAAGPLDLLSRLDDGLKQSVGIWGAPATGAAFAHLAKTAGASEATQIRAAKAGETYGAGGVLIYSLVEAAAEGKLAPTAGALSASALPIYLLHGPTELISEELVSPLDLDPTDSYVASRFALFLLYTDYLALTGVAANAYLSVGLVAMGAADRNFGARTEGTAMESLMHLYQSTADQKFADGESDSDFLEALGSSAAHSLRTLMPYSGPTLLVSREELRAHQAALRAEVDSLQSAQRTYLSTLVDQSATGRRTVAEILAHLHATFRELGPEAEGGPELEHYRSFCERQMRLNALAPMGAWIGISKPLIAAFDPNTGTVRNPTVLLTAMLW